MKNSNKHPNDELNRFWISFDLGLRGNYEALYEWLDRLGADECGDSVATFSTDKTRDQIQKELVRLLGPRKSARIYIIGRRPDGGLGGRFILGGRKQPPWTGYSTRATSEEEEA
jgi:hypothetical protein